MKKFVCVFIIIVLIISVTACSLLTKSPVIEIDGITSYCPTDSENGITEYLFPSQKFLIEFDYKNAEYHYYDNLYLNEDLLEKSFAVLTYETEVYTKAKAYCMDNMILSADNTKEYNGYIFQENMMFQNAQESVIQEQDREYPYFFIMFGYNDSLCSLVFLGFYCKEAHYSSANFAQKDFGRFLDVFYSDYYSFE